MTKFALSKDYLFYMLTLVIIVAGAWLWTFGLEVDPPGFFSGLGQSLSTDPAHCVYHARNKVVFGDPDPFDYSRWIVIQRSMVSVVAHLWFAVAGTSLKQANMVGVLLSLGALIFFLLAVMRHHRPWVLMCVALCYLMNISLMVHGRLAYLENGLMFITSLLFFVYSQWGDRSWGRYLCGVLVAAAMLMGKLLGVLLLPALLLAEWFSHSADRSKRVLSVFVAFLSGSVVLAFLLYSGHPSAAFQYYREGSYGLHGLPEGLGSPWGFAEYFIAYGFTNRLFYLSIDLPIFLWTSGFVLTYMLARGCRLGHLSRVTVLSALTIPCLWLGLSPLSYSPVRYGLLLIPPTIILFFTLLDYVTSHELSGSEKAGYARFGVLFLVSWHALFGIIGMTLPYYYNVSMRALTWISLPPALVVSALIRYLISRRRLTLGRPALYTALAAALLFSVVVNGYRIDTCILDNTDTALTDANADLSTILGSGAVVAGPYAPVLTMNNHLRSFIYYFGVAEPDPTLFKRYPITHLAIDSTNWTEAVKDYPALTGEQPITLYYIRDYAVRIYNIADLFENETASRYQATTYELAAQHLAQNKPREAYDEIGTFLESHPDSRSANIVLSDLLIRSKQFDRANQVLMALSRRYPGDVHVTIVCASSFHIMGMYKKDQQLLRLAEKFYLKAAQKSPVAAENARYIYEITEQRLKGESD